MTALRHIKKPIISKYRFLLRKHHVIFGALPVDKQFATIESPNYQLTSFKCQEHTLNIIMRGYNLSSDDEAPLTLDIPGHQAVRSTLIETVSTKH